MWIEPAAVVGPVEIACFSPTVPHRQTPFSEPVWSVFPAIHTLYYYDKGIS